MKISNIILITMTAAGVASSAATIRDAQAETAAKQKGWYTAAQATRGHQLFNNYCAQCHMPDLSGALGPALKGPQFLSVWKTRTLGDLLAFEHKNMPANNPGSVSDIQLATITAYILNKNGFPAGNAPLVKGKADTRLLRP